MTTMTRTFALRLLVQEIAGTRRMRLFYNIQRAQDAFEAVTRDPLVVRAQIVGTAGAPCSFNPYNSPLAERLDAAAYGPDRWGWRVGSISTESVYYEPDRRQLVAWADEGLTQAEILERLERGEGVVMTPSARERFEQGRGR